MYILITNFHSIKNKGDLGIVIGLIESLRKRNGDLKFAIIGRNITEREWWNKNEIDFFIPLLSFPKSSKNSPINFFINKVNALYFIFDYYFSLMILSNYKLAYWYYRGNKEKLKTLSTYAKADVVISKGGSFFREPEYQTNILPVGIMGHLHQLLIAKKLKKHVALLAQSFGPINNIFSKNIIKKAFDRFDLITVRDSDSKHFLYDKLHISKNVYVSADLAFLLNPQVLDLKNDMIAQSISKNKKSGRLCVGLTVRSWSNTVERNNYLDSLVSFINIYARKNFVFYFMPQVVGPSQVEDDREISRKIVNKLDEEIKKHSFVLEEERGIDELLGLYQMMDYFVATRLHSAIFAMISGVPVIAIGYEPKTISIFKDLGIEQFVIDIRQISSVKVSNLFQLLLKAQKEIFIKARDKAVLSARDNIKKFEKIFT